MRHPATANGGDDESSQAEGTFEGAIGYSRPTNEPNNVAINNNNLQQQNQPHYENIYESIEQYAANNNDIPAAVAAAAVIANAPAEVNHNVINQNAPQQNPTPPAASQPAAVPVAPPALARANNLNIAYRNDLYDRSSNTPAYDVPRAVRSSLGMRRNLQLELTGGRNRCYAPYRQRSFDDTESHHYYNLNYNPVRYENIYEQIHDEPIYRNVNGGTARVYGRLNVIGHGIGRIERHLSSSCGNIDHYNLGGHYAVLGHSHFGTVGHIRLNTSTASTSNSGAQPKDNGVKNSSSSFFSCLGGENSQSLSNIYRASTGATNANIAHFPARPSTPNVARPGTPSVSRNTGAIPKSKGTSAQKPPPQPTEKVTDKALKPKTSPEHNSTLNRMSKSSLQWLLVNKWLPLWVGQGPDCKIIDFNFMFSRNCDGCEYSRVETAPLPQDLVRFNAPKRDPSGRPLRSSLSRVKEAELATSRTRPEENNYENVHVQWHNGFEFGRSRDDHQSRLALMRARSESPTFSQRIRKQRKDARYLDPFKNYELNTENNTFKPKNAKEKFKINDGASTSAGTAPANDEVDGVATNDLGKEPTDNHGACDSGSCDREGELNEIQEDALQNETDQNIGEQKDE